ncbi:MGMT family protein [Pseudobdellovibrio exovorus]|uniref:Methylated-DNA-[protein]-cysteine S-methyltransferase DNA binding domain-containing protein n=1 Tax=Pseudobdellovibrio exovorus JSS TaxID=1184267 RepID=M4VN81_9BACT|nr:MGMT family protein [Pseudobdellovibrio exovorus]AGH94534.1 hypothetical protein A11Q_314 [Pseudobdellovibrio exovorus JSS]
MKSKQPRELTPFTKKVIQVIKKIPKGRVASYGQIATLAGNSGGARGVVWILHSCSDAYDLPWHRVVNSQGLIAIPADRKHHREQRKRLLDEGVLFLSASHVDFKKFQWSKTIPKTSLKKSPKKTNLRKPQMFR